MNHLLTPFWATIITTGVILILFLIAICMVDISKTEIDDYYGEHKD